jgi:hypothetical protein
MVGPVDLRLDEEQILRVANMFLQVRRHGRQWLEQPRENALEGRGYRVGWIRQVKVDRPVIGVDDDLRTMSDRSPAPAHDRDARQRAS